MNKVIPCWINAIRPRRGAGFRRRSASRTRAAAPLRDLRISVTDRCNFRCVYCMPRKCSTPTIAFLPHDALLTLRGDRAPRARLRRPGREKIRLTGGEPLLRRNLRPPGRRCCAELPMLDLTLTTNGSLLAKQARGAARRRA